MIVQLIFLRSLMKINCVSFNKTWSNVSIFRHFMDAPCALKKFGVRAEVTADCSVLYYGNANKR